MLRYGTAAPDDTVGVDGDWFIQTTAGTFFEKTSGTWGSSVVNFLLNVAGSIHANLLADEAVTESKLAIFNAPAADQVVTWNEAESRLEWRDPAGGLNAVSSNSTLAGTGIPTDLLRIADGGVDTTQLANGAVTEAKVASGAITGSKMGAGSVSGNTISDGGVIAGKYSAGSVSTNALANTAVTNAKLRDGAVTNAKIAANVIHADRLEATNTPTTGQVPSYDGSAGFTWVANAAGGGFTLLSGSGAPNDSDGSDGDWYYSTGTGEWFQKSGARGALPSSTCCATQPARSPRPISRTLRSTLASWRTTPSRNRSLPCTTRLATAT